MARITPFTSPLLLGFDAMEKTLERIAKGFCGHHFDKEPFDGGAGGFGTDEALRRDATLARIDQAGRDTDFDSRLQIGVVQDDVRIAAAKLEDLLFQRLSRT